MKQKSFRVSLAFLFLTNIFCLRVYSSANVDEQAVLQNHNVVQGMAKEDFFKIYSKKQARTYRQNNSEEWLTFNEPLGAESKDIVTFHIQDGKMNDWSVNNRQEVINEYLSEFCSVAIIRGMPKIYTAIADTLQRIPFDAFLQITGRRRPVLFTEYYDSGTARFANSSEIIAREDDTPAFEEGMTFIKLSTALDGAETPSAIEGVIAHELAHRVLEHSRKGNFTCAAEREANALVKQWGFEKEYAQASKVFGHQVGDSVSCQEK